jgi:hypothetical protein
MLFQPGAEDCGGQEHGQAPGLYEESNEYRSDRRQAVHGPSGVGAVTRWCGLVGGSPGVQTAAT